MPLLSWLWFACEPADPLYAPTWHADVAPLLDERCGACHQSSGIAPFSVHSYEEAAPFADAMLAAVEAGTMPPFDAATTEECTPVLPYQNDTRLTEEEIALIRDWIEADMPEGESEGRLAPSWAASESDFRARATVALPEPFEITGEHDIYQCFRVEVPRDPGNVWITGVNVVPDNTSVVHHVLVWSDPTDESAGRIGSDGSYGCSGVSDVWPTELVATWAPGGGPTLAPEGTGTLFKEGATLVVNVHYHPNGRGRAVDQTQIELDWTTEQPAEHVTWLLLDIPFGGDLQPEPDDRDGGPEFRIPAGSPDHEEWWTFDSGPWLPFEVRVFSVMPHMHYLGTDLKATIRTGDEEESCLVHAPAYRFSFQQSYAYDAEPHQLPRIRPGDSLEVRCGYDNSWSNPNMEDALVAGGREAPADVYWGEETSDEMCMIGMGLVIPPVDLTDLLSEFF